MLMYMAFVFVRGKSTTNHNQKKSKLHQPSPSRGLFALLLANFLEMHIEAENFQGGERLHCCL